MSIGLQLVVGALVIVVFSVLLALAVNL